jgi:transposase-like protein
MTIDINNLTDEQKRQLIIALQASLKTSPRAEDKLINEIRETRFNAGFKCPHCGSSHVVRHGTYKGNKQRYLCRNCKTTFSDLTNTPMSRTKFPEKWGLFADCMLKGYSLRKSAEIIGVSYVSLFYWRHKLLEALKKTENKPFDGIVEMDETYFLHSEKGKRNIIDRKPRKRGGVNKKHGVNAKQVCVLVARDRCKNTVSQVASFGKIRMNRVDQIVGSLLSHENMLCTDGLHGYRTFAENKFMDHFELKDMRVYKGILHIQNVNAYHSRLKKWIDRFNGVASKYLDNYLAWFKFLDSKRFEDTTGILVESCLHNTQDTNDSIRLGEFKVA